MEKLDLCISLKNIGCITYRTHVSILVIVYVSCIDIHLLCLLKEGTHEKYEFSLDRSQQSTKKVRNLKKKPHIRIISNAKITPVSNSIERPAAPARKFAHFIYPLNCYVTSYLDLMGANKFLYYKYSFWLYTRPVGLVVWFSLRVREVPCSSLGQAGLSILSHI